MNTTELIVEIRPEKISGPYGICSALPTELTSQLGAGHHVGSKETFQVVNNGYKYMKIIYVHCG